jgi:polyhydroxyalkanoate synthesis regulator phasin
MALRTLQRLAITLTFLAAVPVAIKVANKSSSIARPAAQEDVDAAMTKLEKMTVMFRTMLKSEGLSHSKVAPAMRLFADNLQSALNASKSMKPAEAMKTLAAAKAGIAGLVGEMTKHQESLMREDFEQRESLLMGVLMTKKDAPMEEQLRILKHEDFEGLDVSRELLKTHTNKTTLYVQAAQYLDTHKLSGGRMTAQNDAQRQSRLESTAAAFDKRVMALENDAKVQQLRHNKKLDELKASLKSSKEKAAAIYKALIKREDRNYKKWHARSQSDIASMTEAAAAFRTGDVKALNHARAALQKSLDALKSKNGGMLVFLQQAHTLLEKDCPYCAAQCVEKCHSNGNAYVVCLGECADAGKS